MNKTKISLFKKLVILILFAGILVASVSAMGLGLSKSAYAEVGGTYSVPKGPDITRKDNRKDGEGSEYRITDSEKISDLCDEFAIENIDYNYLMLYGYRYVTVTVQLDVREDNAGYQQVYLYHTASDPRDQYLQRMEIKYGGDETVSKYGVVTFEFKSLDMDNFITNGEINLVVRYGATGVGDDDWFNQHCKITTVISCDLKRSRNNATGNITFDYEYNNQ